MAWIYVILAGIIEIFWVIGLKHAEAPLEWAGVALLITISFVLLFRAYKDLPVGTVYAVFTGIGAGGIVLTEIFVFGEPFSIVKVLLIGLIFFGVIGLKRVTEEKKRRRPHKMAWVFLILAGICEIIGVLFMKVATEKKGWAPKVILIANFGVSFFFPSDEHITDGNCLRDLDWNRNCRKCTSRHPYFPRISGLASSCFLKLHSMRRCWLKTIKLT